jgi:hypothetical protein
LPSHTCGGIEDQIKIHIQKAGNVFSPFYITIQPVNGISDTTKHKVKEGGKGGKGGKGGTGRYREIQGG